MDRATVRHRSRGQATVEFVLVSLFILVMVMMTFGMMWVACQKWYFSFTTMYAARVWSVQPRGSYSPQEALLAVQGMALARHERLETVPLVRWINASFMPAGGYDPVDRFGDFTFPPGIRFQGAGSYTVLFNPHMVRSSGLEWGANQIIFETYVPITHEEDADGPEISAARNRDNDR